jgi:hypothetical protein
MPLQAQGFSYKSTIKNQEFIVSLSRSNQGKQPSKTQVSAICNLVNIDDSANQQTSQSTN